MAKTKQDKKLYSRMRDAGLRKKVARQLSELPSQVSGAGSAPKPLRDAVDRLEAAVGELKTRAGQAASSATARKPAPRRARPVARRKAKPASKSAAKPVPRSAAKPRRRARAAGAGTRRPKA